MKYLHTKTAKILVAGLIMWGISVATPAFADDHHRDIHAVRHDDWRRHEVDAHDWHRHHPVVVPGVVYAPPAVVYAPPPPPSGISLIIPFDIR